MYIVDVTDAEILLTYSDIFKEDKPDLIESIKNLNMHKAISIICELLRVRDSHMEPLIIFNHEFKIPLETVLKKEMCDIVPKSEEEMFSNPLMQKDNHIISVQMLFIFGATTSLSNILEYFNKEEGISIKIETLRTYLEILGNAKIIYK